jgi:hypothetical protein
MVKRYEGLENLSKIGEGLQKRKEYYEQSPLDLLTSDIGEVGDFFGLTPREAGFTDAFKRGLITPKDYALAQQFAQDPNDETRAALLKELEPTLGYTTIEEVRDDPSKIFSYLKQLAGSSFGFQAAPLVAGGVGALTAGPVGGVGAYSALSSLQYGVEGLQRQASEIQKKVDEGKVPPSLAFDRLLISSTGSAALDVFGFKFVQAFKPIGRLIGLNGKKDITKMADEIVDAAMNPTTKKVSMKTFAQKASEGALSGGLSEIPQEVAQTVLSRWQAGMSLDNTEAKKEYLEAGLGGLILGSSLGAVTNFGNRTELESKISSSLPPAATTTPALPDAPGTDLVTTPSFEDVQKRLVDDAARLKVEEEADLAPVNELEEKINTLKIDGASESTQPSSKVNYEFDNAGNILGTIVPEQQEQKLITSQGGATLEEVNDSLKVAQKGNPLAITDNNKTENELIEAQKEQSAKEDTDANKFGKFDLISYLELQNKLRENVGGSLEARIAADENKTSRPLGLFEFESTKNLKPKTVREEAAQLTEEAAELNPIEEDYVDTLKKSKETLRGLGVDNNAIFDLENKIKTNDRTVFQSINKLKKEAVQAARRNAPGSRKQQQIVDALIGFVKANGALDSYKQFVDKTQAQLNQDLSDKDSADASTKAKRAQTASLNQELERLRDTLALTIEQREIQGLQFGDPFRAQAPLAPLNETSTEFYNRIFNEKQSEAQREDRILGKATLNELDENIRLLRNRIKDVQNQRNALNESLKAKSIDSKAQTAIEENNLAAALDTIVKQGGVLGKIASRLKSLNLNTAIRYAPAFVNGKRVAGHYNPKTDTITIDPEFGGGAQTLLHEATHAATIHIIEGKGKDNINVKLLKELFEAAKPLIDPDLSIDAPKNLAEFVAEVFTNPELQKALSKFRYKNTKQTLWNRFVNYIRRMFRLQPNSDMSTEANRLIQEIIQEPRDNTDVSYFSDNLYAQSIAHGERGVLNTTFGATDRFIRTFGSSSTPVQKTKEKLAGIGRWTSNQLIKFMPLTYFVKYAKQFLPKTLQKYADRIETAINEKAAYLSMMRERTQPIVSFAEKLRGKDREGFSILDRLINESTFDSIPLTLNAEQAAQVGANEGDVVEIGSAYYEILKNKKMEEGVWEQQKQQIDNMIREFAELKRRDPGFVKVYNDFRKGYETLWTEISNQLEPLINETIDADSNIRQGILERIQRRIIERSKADPYFALTRFGEFKLSYAHPITGEQVVRFFETDQARQLAYEDIQQQYIRQLIEKNPDNYQPLLDLQRANEERRKDPNKQFVNFSMTNEQAASNYSTEAYDFYRGGRELLESYDSDTIIAFNRMAGAYTFTNAKDIATAHLDSLPSDSIIKKLQVILNDAGVNDEQQKDFYNILIDTMPEVVLLSNLKTRKNVRGAAEDSIRAFASVTDSLIRRAANFKYNRVLQNSVEQMQESTVLDAQGVVQGREQNYTHPFDYPEGRVDEAQEFVKRFQQRVDFAKNPNFNGVANFMTGLSFHWMMGFNISSALLQITQLPLVGVPILGSKYGYVKTGGAITSAMRAITGAGFKRKIVDLAGNEVIENVNPSLLNYSPEELSALDSKLGLPSGATQELILALQATHQIGKSSIQEYMDLGKTATGEYGATKKGIAMFQKASAFSFHVAEQAQRETMGLATFELSYKKKIAAGMNSSQAMREAIAEAKTTIDYVNGPSTTEATAQISQSNWGKVLTIFKQYGFSMYSLLFLTLQRALPNVIRSRITNAQFSQEEVNLARKQVIGLYGAGALIGGIQGVPFFFIPEVVYNTLIRDEGEEDFETLARKTFGEAPFDRMTGLAISGRASYRDLLFRETKGGLRTEAEFQAEVYKHIFGAPGSIPAGFVKGANTIAEGNTLRGVEYMIPVFMRNLLRSARFATEGVTTGRGDVVVPEVSYKNVVAQILGLGSLQTTLPQEAVFEQVQLERAGETKYGRLTKKLYFSVRNNDYDTYKETYEELLELGEAYPKLKVTPSKIQKSMRRRQKVTDEMLFGADIDDDVAKEVIERLEKAGINVDNLL